MFAVKANKAREKVRSLLNERIQGSEIHSARRDHYTYGTPDDFQFTFIVDLAFKPGIAYFQPLIAVCNSELSERFRALENKSYFKCGRPNERWKPKNYLHCYGLQSDDLNAYFFYDGLLEAVHRKFEQFHQNIAAYDQVVDAQTLRTFLEKEKAFVGPTGDLMMMFLDHILLDEDALRERYSSQQFPVMQKQFLEATLSTYP
ncbi:MAG: hypothetical protein AAF562_07085 [Pseudomonadota bacterium]